MRFRFGGDRLFACVAIALTGIYGYFAFFEISAPIQYDPLGPEGWPRFLAVAALLLCIPMLRRPATRDAVFAAGPARQVLLAAAMIWAYAAVFEWLGFALATTLFCAGLAGLMGASKGRAALFGITAGIGLYGLSVHLLGLNLP